MAGWPTSANALSADLAAPWSPLISSSQRFDSTVTSPLTLPQLSSVAGSLAMLASWPTARPAQAFPELFLRPPNTSFARHGLFGIVDPADELVTCQWRDVVPGIECGRVGDQCLAQVFGKVVN